MIAETSSGSKTHTESQKYPKRLKPATKSGEQRKMKTFQYKAPIDGVFAQGVRRNPPIDAMLTKLLSRAGGADLGMGKGDEGTVCTVSLESSPV